MESGVYKIGEGLEITENFEFETLGGRKFEVKAGDRGVLTSNGFIIYVTGEARGCIQRADCEMEGYDNRNIAQLIYDRLDGNYGIGDMLDDEEAEIRCFIDDILDVLSDIL